MLEITAFEDAQDYGEHFKGLYGPTIVARANAEKNGRADEFDRAVRDFCDEWNLSESGPARFEQEYLVAVGTKRSRAESTFDQAVRDFCDEWNLSESGPARFEQEYLVAVGTKTG